MEIFHVMLKHPIITKYNLTVIHIIKLVTCIIVVHARSPPHLSPLFLDPFFSHHRHHHLLNHSPFSHQHIMSTPKRGFSQSTITLRPKITVKSIPSQSMQGAASLRTAAEKRKRSLEILDSDIESVEPPSNPRKVIIIPRLC